MSVNPVANSVSSYVKQVLSGANSQNALAVAQEEATESAAATRQEALHHDPVAMRKLARQQQEQQLQDPTPAQEPGKGELVNQSA